MPRLQGRHETHETHGTHRGRLAVLAATALLILLAVILTGGCGGGTPDSKVVIIGIDGMDWNIADPLIEAGKMPNLARIIENGVRADLLSLEPLQKSPTIWTTIATGKGPRKHGIADFIEGSDEQPLFNALGWRARAIWDILGEKGYSVGVIAWLVGWPAQTVNGYFVTDRIIYSPEDGYGPIEHLTYPPELAEELAPLRKSYAATTDDEVAPYLGGDLWRPGGGETQWGGVETVKTIYAHDETVLRAAMHMLESREQPGLFAVYFLGLDRCCHRFWGPMRPRSVDIRMTDEFIDTFQNTIPSYYERVDELIGSVLEAIDENSTVIVCSDHGFRGPRRTKEGIQLGIQMHRAVGVLAAMGPGIRSGGSLSDAGVMDITPTLLALLGEPVGRDMDGFVIEELIDEAYLEQSPVRYIDTYEKERVDENGEPLESSVDEEIKEQLRSLGYIE